MYNNYVIIFIISINNRKLYLCKITPIQIVAKYIFFLSSYTMV